MSGRSPASPAGRSHRATGQHDPLREATTLAPSERKSLLDYIFFQASAEVSHEQAQAMARVALGVITLGILSLLEFLGRITDPDSLLANRAVVLYLIASVPYYLLVARFPDRLQWRRYLAIAADLSIVSFGTYVYQVDGLAFYPLYLWVTIGNGLRFGVHYLGIATLGGVVGFVVATLASGAWAQLPSVSLGLLVGMVIIPKFFLAMVVRLAEANAQLRERFAETAHIATHDVLTDLPNRGHLEQRMVGSLAHAQRTGTRLAVAFIDLDGFKSINDSFGHAVGDQLLKEVADCLRQRLRSGDMVARLGGDEFILLIEDCGSAADVAALVERVSGCVGRYFELDQHRTFVTWSCGVALYPEDGAEVATLVKHADTAMYRAKAAGGNQVRFYDLNMSREVADQLALRDELRVAIEAEQFQLHYQPQVELGSGRLVGVEALIRWRHPSRGVVAPAQFIGAAEKTGLILPIGDWVLERVCQDWSAWRRQGLAPVSVAVNVSGRQFMQQGFPEAVAAILGRHEMPAHFLALEMTESVLIEESRALGDTFQRLKALGVRLSLDDFGTGYSSLSYLKRFPIDTLKIDRSFVRDIPADHNDCALVEAMLAIGRSLGMEVVAEGVETAEQAQWLQQRGCRQVQGYLVGRPMPAVELLARLDAAGWAVAVAGSPA